MNMCYWWSLIVTPRNLKTILWCFSHLIVIFLKIGWRCSSKFHFSIVGSSFGGSGVLLLTNHAQFILQKLTFS